MSNVLTDILGLDAKDQYKSTLDPKDAFIIGDVNRPVMLGISSPIPIKDEKLVTFYDLALSTVGLIQIKNVGGGAQLVREPSQTGNPFKWEVRTLTSSDSTVAITEVGTTELDFSATFSTDVHVNGFSFDAATNILTITLNSGVSFTADISSLNLSVGNGTTPVDTSVNNIQFIGDGVTVSPGASAGIVQVSVPTQEENVTLLSNNIYFQASRSGGGTYTQLPPLSDVSDIYRFGGLTSITNVVSPFAKQWTTDIADVTLGANPQTFVAKEDQINLAIPTPTDILATDKIRVTGTCWILQDLLLHGQAKLKVAIAKGECDDDKSFQLINDFNTDIFSGVAEGSANARVGAYQRICFTAEALAAGDGIQKGTDHVFVGFSFVGLNLPSTGTYTEYINMNYIVTAVKNPI